MLTGAFLPRFVVLPKWAAEMLALWIIHTYTFQFRDVSTYLGIESPEKQCGKTTLLTLLNELVNRPIAASNVVKKKVAVRMNDLASEVSWNTIGTTVD